LEVDPLEPALQTQTIAAEYDIFFLEDFDSNEINQAIKTLKDKTSVNRVRRGKSYDLRPLLLDLEIIMEKPSYLKMILKSKASATGRPEEVLDELNIPVEFTRIKRKKIILVSDLVENS
jgi:hypothetical protein